MITPADCSVNAHSGRRRFACVKRKRSPHSTATRYSLYQRDSADSNVLLLEDRIYKAVKVIHDRCGKVAYHVFACRDQQQQRRQRGRRRHQLVAIVSSNRTRTAFTVYSPNSACFSLAVRYRWNLWDKGPRRMHITLPFNGSFPADSSNVRSLHWSKNTRKMHRQLLQSLSTTPTSSPTPSHRLRQRQEALHTSARRLCIPEDIATEIGAFVGDSDGHTRLLNKTPPFSEDLQAFVLDFNGSVSMASAKNFQLIQDDADREQPLMQFGKIGRDLFSMEVEEPLSLLHSFCVALTSFDHTILCQ